MAERLVINSKDERMLKKYSIRIWHATSGRCDIKFTPIKKQPHRDVQNAFLLGLTCRARVEGGAVFIEREPSGECEAFVTFKE